MVNNLPEKISKLKEKRNAVILAHNYQRPEVQMVADYLGDSLDLARLSAELDADLVVFAGVNFMAEMAAILDPDKRVVIPDRGARCPMASQLPASTVRRERKEHPSAAVVLYVNTLAEAKAEADVVCTSANAPQIVNFLSEEEILFGPDRNLAWFVQRRSDKRIVPIPANGHCYVHKMFSPEDIRLLRERYPDAEVLVHPECDPEVQMLADHICSTSQMMLRAKASPARQFIIGTEIGLVERLRREIPDKEFIPALNSAVCKDMKKHTLEKVYVALRDKKYVVRVSPKVAERALEAVQRMLKISGRGTSD
ncbi:MAG: quinolinate synthase NadA [Hadesarchaea archaeon]|nr:quinolinate synthase NadA [Hadesarchaea archaeon]